jgi:DNA-binding MarR family transcriptional regulator
MTRKKSAVVEDMSVKNMSVMKTPFEDPCSCFYLRRAARIVTRQYAETMKAAGLKSSQFSILAMLTTHGELTITELADKMGLERTSMSRTLHPMEKDGLISVSDELDNRRRYITLTKQGQATFKKALPLWNKAQQQFTEQLGAEDMQTLKKLLKQTAELVGK